MCDRLLIPRQKARVGVMFGWDAYSNVVGDSSTTKVSKQNIENNQSRTTGTTRTRTRTSKHTCVIRSGRKHLTTSSFRNGLLSNSRQSKGSFSSSGAAVSNHSRKRGADSATSFASFENLHKKKREPIAESLIYFRSAHAFVWAKTC